MPQHYSYRQLFTENICENDSIHREYDLHKSAAASWDKSPFQDKQTNIAFQSNRGT